MAAFETAPELLLGGELYLTEKVTGTFPYELERYRCLVTWLEFEERTETCPIAKRKINYQFWKLDPQKLYNHLKRDVFGLCRHTEKNYKTHALPIIRAEYEKNEKSRQAGNEVPLLDWFEGPYCLFDHSQVDQLLHYAEAQFKVQIFGFCPECEAHEFRNEMDKFGTLTKVFKKYMNGRYYLGIKRGLAISAVDCELALLRDLCKCLPSNFTAKDRDNIMQQIVSRNNAKGKNTLQDFREIRIIKSKLFGLNFKLTFEDNFSKMFCTIAEKRKMKVDNFKKAESIYAFNIGVSGHKRANRLSQTLLNKQFEKENEFRFALGADVKLDADKWRGEIIKALTPKTSHTLNFKYSRAFDVTKNWGNKSGWMDIRAPATESSNFEPNNTGGLIELYPGNSNIRSKWLKAEMKQTEVIGLKEIRCISDAQFPCDIIGAFRVLVAMLPSRSIDPALLQDGSDPEKSVVYSVPNIPIDAIMFGDNLKHVKVCNYGLRDVHGLKCESFIVEGVLENLYEIGFPKVPYSYLFNFGNFIDNKLLTFASMFTGGSWSRPYRFRKIFWTENQREFQCFNVVWESVDGEGGVAEDILNANKEDASTSSQEGDEERAKEILRTSKKAIMNNLFMRVEKSGSFLSDRKLVYDSVVKELNKRKDDADFWIAGLTALANIGSNTDDYKLRKDIAVFFLNCFDAKKLSSVEEFHVCEGIRSLAYGLMSVYRFRIEALDFLYFLMEKIFGELKRSPRDSLRKLCKLIDNYHIIPFCVEVDKSDIIKRNWISEDEGKKWHEMVNQIASLRNANESLIGSDIQIEFPYLVKHDYSVIEKAVDNFSRADNKNSKVAARLRELALQMESAESSDKCEMLYDIGYLACHLADNTCQVKLYAQIHEENWTLLPEFDLGSDKASVNMLRKCLQYLEGPYRLFRPDDTPYRNAV